VKTNRVPIPGACGVQELDLVLTLLTIIIWLLVAPYKDHLLSLMDQALFLSKRDKI
jgi:hypothetical protein